MIHEGHEITRKDARILSSTDASGEGLNLQFCHVVINYDIPWNPIRLPQVRNYRLNLLAQEQRNFQEQLDQKARAYPEIMPLLVIRVDGGGHE